MRIGEITRENYKEFLQQLGLKSNDMLDRLLGEEEEELTFEEIHASLIKKGCLEEGMLIPSGDTSWQKIVPVTDEIEQKLIDTVRRQFITNGNGMSETRDGDEIGAIMKEYRKNIPPSERLAVTWTLGEIAQKEATRLVEFIKSKDPNWKHGQAFDKNWLLSTNFGENDNTLDKKV